MGVCPYFFWGRVARVFPPNDGAILLPKDDFFFGQAEIPSWPAVHESHMAFFVPNKYRGNLDHHTSTVGSV